MVLRGATSLRGALEAKHINIQQNTRTHNNTKQHTTTLHNSTRVHKTTNVPVVFMALVLNGFEGCSATSLLGALEGVGPENRDFFGPWNGTSEASVIWAHPPPKCSIGSCRHATSKCSTKALEFFGPKMALAYRLDAISQGPKNSRFPFQPPPTCPRNVSAHIKNITHGAISIIGA